MGVAAANSSGERKYKELDKFLKNNGLRGMTLIDTNYEGARRCANCGAVTGVKRCSGCLEIYYCSTECQKFHWTIHKVQCRIARKFLKSQPQ